MTEEIATLREELAASDKALVAVMAFNSNEVLRELRDLMATNIWEITDLKQHVLNRIYDLKKDKNQDLQRVVDEDIQSTKIQRKN